MVRQFYIVLLLIVGVATACTSSDPILIGVVGPFSQDRGISMLQAAEMAVAEINRAGGVNQRPIELVAIDDSGSTSAAVRAARRLYDDSRVVAVVGHLTSGTSIAAGAVYNGGLNPLPAISPSASSPQLSSVGPYTYRIVPSDEVHGSRLAQWALGELEAETAAILYQNDDYGRGVRQTFENSFTTSGGLIVSVDAILPELPSFEPFVRLLAQNGGADVLLLAVTRDVAERVIPEVRRLGITTQLLGGDAISGIEQGTTDAVGTYISIPYLPDQTGAANTSFVRAYRSTYGTQPDHRGAGAYDILSLLKLAIESSRPDRESIRRFLETVRGTNSFEGVTGRIAFDDNGDVPTKSAVIGVVSTSGLIAVGGQ